MLSARKTRTCCGGTKLKHAQLVDQRSHCNRFEMTFLWCFVGRQRGGCRLQRWIPATDETASVCACVHRREQAPASRSHTDSYETRTESTSSKKIDRIRFVLKRKETADAVMASLADASHVYKVLKDEFNLSPRQFSEISENRDTWTDERIQQAIEYTRFRLHRGQVKKSPSGYLMKALRDNWKMSEAERTMVDVQAKLLSNEVKPSAEAAAVPAPVARSIASREEESRARMNDEATLGREHYLAADERSKREFIRGWVTSREGKLMLRRMKLEPTDVTEGDILANKELGWYLGQFVFGRMSAARAGK